MAKPARRASAASASQLSIRDLISYRLSRTASLMSRGAALRYRREFDVSLGEWRALALLATGAPQSLIHLSRAAGLDKAQMSRVVTSLIDRHLVLREMSPSGGRAVELSLTKEGRRVYVGLIASAGERDRAFRAALGPAELAVLDGALDKLADAARLFIKDESALTLADED
jgi:DNA-binding MarR family transcriptional regulator